MPLFNLPEEPHPKTGVNPCSTAVSLINPPGPATGGPGHHLLNAIANVLHTYSPLLLPPDKSVQVFLKDLPKQNRRFSSQG